MNILMALAGRGTRFSAAGYEKPKPLIDVDGRAMIDRVLINMEPYWPLNENNKYIFICLSEFYSQYKEEFESITEPYNKSIITVDNVTDGAACTALLAKDLINTDEALVITDCDHLNLEHGWLKEGVNFFTRRDADAGLWNFWADDPKWSYCRIANNKVIEVVEKQVVSNFANTGTFYFKHGKYFVDAAERMIHKNDRQKGEFYVSGVYNYLISDGLRVLPFMTNEFWGLGTPVDLQRFLEYENSRTL